MSKLIDSSEVPDYLLHDFMDIAKELMQITSPIYEKQGANRFLTAISPYMQMILISLVHQDDLEETTHVITECIRLNIQDHLKKVTNTEGK